MTTIASRLGFLSALLLSAIAFGQINVDRLDGSDWINIAQHSAGSDVTFDDSTGSTYKVYTLTPTTQSIGNLTINSSGTNAPTLFVGQGLFVPTDETRLSTPGAYNIGSISYSGGQPRLQVRVNNTITGEISFWHIVRIDAGNILANITHDPVGATTPPRLGYIAAGDIGSYDTNYYVAAKRGDIGSIAAAYCLFSRIQCDNGSITGVVSTGSQNVGGFMAPSSIKALNGSINDVISFGQIATGSPTYTTNVQIQAKSGIHLVQSHNTMRAGHRRERQRRKR